MKRLSYPLPREQAYDLFEETRERSANGAEDEQTVDAIVSGKDLLADDLHTCKSLMWATKRYEDEQSLGYKRCGFGPPEQLSEPPVPNN